VLNEYGNRVRVIRQEHGGQASAVNAAWAHATGGALIFLDADDMLDEDTAQRVAEAFAGSPSAGKVQFALEYVDAGGVRKGKFVPHQGRALPNGDLRSEVLRYGDDLPSAPMSGNAYARSVVEKIMPIPEVDYPSIGADVYLINLAALYGPVLSLERPGGRYRIHGRNAYFHAYPDRDRLAAMIALTERTHAHMERHARAKGLSVPKRGVGSDSLIFPALLLIQHQLSPNMRLLPDRTTLAFARRGITASLRRRDRSRRLRALFAAWFLVTGLSPGPLARLCASFAYARMRKI
jgi:glycosyltransferase involved in cell wall biosynthesis